MQSAPAEVLAQYEPEKEEDIKALLDKITGVGHRVL
jgi:hypothetical protein